MSRTVIYTVHYESSDGNEELGIRNWRKGHHCYKMAKTWLNHALGFLWKEELKNKDQENFLEKKFSKQQNTQGAACLLLTVCSKV
jgi:hypothetical protein